MFNRNFVVKIRPIKPNYVQVPDHYQKLISVYVSIFGMNFIMKKKLSKNYK